MPRHVAVWNMKLDIRTYIDCELANNFRNYASCKRLSPLFEIIGANRGVLGEHMPTHIELSHNTISIGRVSMTSSMPTS